MSLTTIRVGIQTELQRELGIRFVAGMLVGPIDTGNLGCVWTPGVRERANVQEQDVILKSRVYLQWKPTDETLRDPAALENLAETFLTALRDEQVNQYGVWMYRVAEIEIDLETNGIEATITAVRANPFSMGG